MKFSFTSKKEEDKDDDFKITETMYFNQLPQSTKNQFIEVYKLIKDNRQYLKEESLLESKNRGEVMYDEMEKIKDLCMNDLFFSIYSFGHQIDNGKKILNEYKIELSESKNDHKNTNSIKTFPSPFLVRYSKHLEDISDSISEEIEAYRGHLQSLSNNSENIGFNKNQKKNDILYNFFNEEYEALLRSSTKISQLCKKLSFTRSHLCQKLQIDQSRLMTDYKNTEDSIFSSIQTKYKQFLSNKKFKMQKSIDESDLFGKPTKIEAQKPAPKSFFSNSSFIANREKRNANNFTPPPPKLQIQNTPAITISNKAHVPPQTPPPNKKNPFNEP